MATTDTNLTELVINTLTQSEYTSATKSENELYLITDATLELGELGNVTLTSPTDNQILKYDATNQVWINGSGGSGGSVAFADITGQPTDNTNLATALNAKSSVIWRVHS